MPKKPVQKRKPVKKNPTTKQVGSQTRDPKTGRITGGVPPVGFHTHPEKRNDGRWQYSNSYSYWLSKLERMSFKELKAFRKQYNDDEMTVAMMLAWEHTNKAMGDLGFAKERSDRTVGKAVQAIDHTTDGESLNQYKALDADELRKLAG